MAKKSTRRKKRSSAGQARSRKTKAQLLEELDALQQDLEKLQKELEASRQQVTTPAGDVRPDQRPDEPGKPEEEDPGEVLEQSPPSRDEPPAGDVGQGMEALEAQLTEARTRGEELERAMEDARNELSRAGESARKMQARAETNERRLQTVTRELVELREDTRGVVTRLRVEMERKDRELTDRALRIEALRAEVEALRKRRRRDEHHDG